MNKKKNYRYASFIGATARGTKGSGAIILQLYLLRIAVYIPSQN